MRRIFAGVAVSALTVTLAPFASGPAHADVPEQLIVSEDRPIDHLNPLNDFFAISTELNNLMYTPLVRWGADDFAASEGLAVEWEASEDQLEWTYTLREDAQWSDGEDITAADAEFTFNLMLDDDDAYANNLDLMQHFDAVTAVDDYELLIELNSPTSMMSVLDRPILPAHVWEDVEDPAGIDNTEFDDFVGSGPFLPVEFSADELIRFEANDNHFEGAPAYDELVFDYYQTSEAAVQALEQGEVDVISGLNAQQFEALEGTEGIEVNDSPGRRTTSITFNVGAEAQDGTSIGTGHEALQDPAVRQAIHHAIDKGELVERVEAGLAEVGVSYIPPIFDAYWDPGDQAVEFDVEEGNRILDDAGYELNDDDVRVSPDGEELNFRLLYHSDRADYALIQDFLVDWIAELGIELEPESARSDSLNDDLYAGDFDVIFSGWTVNADPTSILNLYTCDALPADEDDDARNTDTFYCNEDYDDLQEQQRAEPDPGDRNELIAEMQEILYTDAPHVTLYYGDSLEAYNSDRWGDFQTQPADNGAIRGQAGVWGYVSATPVEEAAESETSMWPVWIAVGAAVLLAAAVAVFLIVRRSTAADRE